MKRCFFVLLMVACFINGYSQPASVEGLSDWRENLMTQKGQTIGNERFSTLADKTVFWWDGSTVLQMIGSGEKDDEWLMYNVETNTIIYEIKAKGSTGTIERRGLTVSLQKLGNTLIMVEREGGKIYNILTQINTQQAEWHLIDLHDVLDGLYTTPDGKQYVFGEPEMFEGIDSDTQDPGMFRLSNEDDHRHSAWNYRILYGNGRISRGTYVEGQDQKMPGAGGAGALMGPMEWGLNHTEAGLAGKVLHDEPTVDHHPEITEDFTLTKMQNPFKGVDGFWAFASVRPLNLQMLIRFPKEILRLMRNEIFARHGEKFTSDKNLQAYFDRQPWYKALANPTPLTALEKLNVSLIKAVEEKKNEK